jgi:hypothetical protein
MQLTCVPSAATIEGDILATQGSVSVDGVLYTTENAAANARRRTAVTLARVADRLRHVAHRAPEPLETLMPEVVDSPYVRCAWCTDFIERGNRAYGVRTLLLHERPCVAEFMGAPWADRVPPSKPVAFIAPATLATPPCRFTPIPQLLNKRRRKRPRYG